MFERGTTPAEVAAVPSRPAAAPTPVTAPTPVAAAAAASPRAADSACAAVPAAVGVPAAVQSTAAHLPAALADLPPGPTLGAALAGIDRSILNGYDRVLVLRAQARQVAHEQARLLADLVAVADCPPAPDLSGASPREADEFISCEIAAALTWTRQAAETHLGLAWSLTCRIPAVHAALTAGVIDLAKARVFDRETDPLPQGAARAVCDQLLPDAPQLTTGQLRAKLQRLVLTVDPDAARVRQAEAVTRRRVLAGLDFDGTVSISVLGLPAPRATAAMERIDAIADAARRGGDLRTIDQLRADTVLDLLDGTTIAGPLPGPRKGVIELTVPLTTLMGLAEEPGELAGWGPIAADITRDLADQHHNVTWRYRVTDADGHLVGAGTTRRPTTRMDAFVRARDRTCRFPGCRRCATRTDLDHTVAYTEDGPTHPANLGALCRTHHRTKHEGGWTLVQGQPGVFHWTSPHGHHYTVQPERPDHTQCTACAKEQHQPGQRAHADNPDPRPPPTP